MYQQKPIIPYNLLYKKTNNDFILITRLIDSIQINCENNLITFTFYMNGSSM